MVWSGHCARARVVVPRPNPRAASERASDKARRVPNRMIYPLLCVHEALLDCLESSDRRARAFLRAGDTMKLVSVHRSDRLLISNESPGRRAEKEPASRYSPRDRSSFPASPCGRTQNCARFAPPCARPLRRREYPRAALMPTGWFHTRRSRRAACVCSIDHCLSLPYTSDAGTSLTWLSTWPYAIEACFCRSRSIRSR